MLMKRDLVKIFCVVVAAELILHYPVTKKHTDKLYDWVNDREQKLGGDDTTTT